MRQEVTELRDHRELYLRLQLVLHFLQEQRRRERFRVSELQAAAAAAGVNLQLERLLALLNPPCSSHGLHFPRRMRGRCCK